MIYNSIPPIFQKPKIDEFQISKEDAEQLTAWMSDPACPAVFEGDPGRGKSYAAAKCTAHLGKKFQIEGYKSGTYKENFFAFVVLSDLYQEWLSKITSHNSLESLTSNLKNVDVLTLDDIGIRPPTDGFLDFLYSIVNHRVNYELITIYTTNFSSKETNEKYGPRMVSRMYSGIKIEFRGEDLRLKYRKNFTKEKK